MGSFGDCNTSVGGVREGDNIPSPVKFVNAVMLIAHIVWRNAHTYFAVHLLTPVIRYGHCPGNDAGRFPLQNWLPVSVRHVSMPACSLLCLHPWNLF